MPEKEARPRVKNRHGGAPRGERPASWDARRLASAWRVASQARSRASCDAPRACPKGASQAPERLSALRPPLGSGERSKVANPGRKNAPRERDGLFDIVRWPKRETRPHPEERACASASAKSKGRARVSKDGDGHGVGPSCFEAPRCARLLSMRARQAHARANLRLWGTIAGCAPLFPDCYLQ